MAGLQLAWSFILLTSITWRTSAFFLWWQNVTRGGIQKLIFWFCLLCCQEAEKKRYKENVVVSVAFLFKRHWYLWRGLKCWKKNYLEIWTEQKKKRKKWKCIFLILAFDLMFDLEVQSISSRSSSEQPFWFWYPKTCSRIKFWFQGCFFYFIFFLLYPEA